MPTKNFKEAEFACPCCKRSYVTPELLTALQELRDLTNEPIHILSGYRCVTQNKKDGGSPKSMHMAGKAADIYIKGYSVTQMYNFAEKVPAFRDGGIGIYPNNNFIHVDVRNQKARWARVNVKEKKKVIQKYVSIEEGLKHV